MLFIYLFVMFCLLSGAATTLLEIPAFRQSAVGIVLSRPFLLRSLRQWQRMKWGSGKSPDSKAIKNLQDQNQAISPILFNLSQSKMIAY
jgi:hypothetical protein